MSRLKKISVFYAAMYCCSVMHVGWAEEFRWYEGGLAYWLSRSNDYCAEKINAALLPDEPTYKYEPSTFNKEGCLINTEQVFFDDIVGLDNALDDVKEVVDCLKNPQRYIDIGAKLPKGILLEGPPGCGKTMIAKAMATEAGCAFLYASASDFVQMYVGVGASRIRELFAKARAKTPAIIFIDEIDAIGAVERGAGGNEEYRQTLNALLTELDGFQANGRIVVVVATNFADALDKALTRSGRLDRLIKITMPDEHARFDLLKSYLSKLPRVADDVDNMFLRSIAQACDGLSPADIKVLVNDAPMIALRHQDSVVAKKHVAIAFERIMDQRKQHGKKNPRIR